MLTGATGSYCNGGRTSFTFYKLQGFEICFLNSFMIKNYYGNSVAVFEKLSHVCT